MNKSALGPDALFHGVNADEWDFNTSDELADLAGFVGQERAQDAIRFGVGIRHFGYNLYVMGPANTGSRDVVQAILAEQARNEPPPSDWCYVNNFRNPQQPRLLRLPAGAGVPLRDAMEALVRDLLSAIPATFESEEYRNRRSEIEQAFKNRREQALSDIEQDAEQQNIALVRTPTGMVFTPRRGDAVMTNDEFEQLPEQEQLRIDRQVDSLRKRMEDLFGQLPLWRRELLQRIRELDYQAVMAAVGHLLETLKERYATLPDVVSYLNEVEHSVVEHATDFSSGNEPDQELAGIDGSHGADKPALRRYKVNVLVDNSETEGAPVIYADNPSYNELLGRAEYLNQFGTLVTNFTLIRGGALHRANDGYLVLDARQLLTQPFAWDGLKRCLFARHIRIESPGQMLSLVSTVSLEPETVPLNLKVILVGERLLYYLLYHYDPDFRELFKVAADFDDDMERSPSTLLLHARLLATLARRDKLLPLQRDAIARLLEHSSRLAGDSQKLSVWIRDMADLLREADHWARQAGHTLILANDIRTAIAARIHRSDRVRSRHQEAIQRGTLLIDTSGSRVGQVNGLTVVDLGDFEFGFPTRISACVRLGSGKVVDIQREVALGGPIHSKGVLILSGFLGGRYCADRPLSLSASLVFEQTYSQVEGDSASCAELCALLSALAEIPIKQSLAVTGSVNQHGEVQAIGGVNEKIEGFFDICSQRGLSGDQGVLIPAANIPHLMLREDVVDACRDNLFRVYAVASVDEALALLTGLPPGSCDSNGLFPEGSVNFRVEQRLIKLAEQARNFGRAGKKAGDNET